MFLHPNASVRLGKKPAPPLLAAFPELKEEITSFCVKNLAVLSLDKVKDLIANKLIPKVYKEARAHSDDEDNLTMERFLAKYRLTTVSFNTAWRWMRYLGFNHDTRKKSFYVDGHERADVIDYRTKIAETFARLSFKL